MELCHTPLEWEERSGEQLTGHPSERKASALNVRWDEAFGMGGWWLGRAGEAAEN